MKHLKSNATGPLVGFLKASLRRLGYQQSDNDRFDAGTLSAVSEFQNQAGLAVDGIVGPDTWVAIYVGTVQPRRVQSRIERNDNIMLLHPRVRKAVVATYVQLQAEAVPFRVFEAYRFPQRQEDLYAQGRTKDGNIVTYARPWSSYHQYGLAVDFVLYIGGNWSWAGNTAALRNWWTRLHQIGAAEGLMRLDFETPHLQLAGTSSNSLREGLYPSGADEDWTENINSAIVGWHGDPAAPPKANHSSIRPPL